MADLTELLRDIRGVYSDRARDRLPEGSVWVMADWVPLLMQAGARIRGAWKYQSTAALPAPPDGMLYAPYIAGAKLLVANGAALSDVPLVTPGAATPAATIPATRQHPIFHRNRVIVPAADGVSAARIIDYGGTLYGFTGTNSVIGGVTNPALGRYATIFKDRTVLGNQAAQPSRVIFSTPGHPELAFDQDSYYDTSYPVTGLAVQRAQVLCFHDSSVERLRGTEPADSTLPTGRQDGDLVLDVLWDRAGCYDARSISYWQDNVLFADARGIQLTDGSLVRNITAQAGVINLWHEIFNRNGPPLSVAGGVYRDYYLCTIRHTGFEPFTFVVEIPTRRMFTLKNIDSTCFAFSVATVEKLFGSNQATSQVTDLSPVFDPDATVMQIDANGLPVLPSISTGWHMLTKKSGFKRVIEAHISYEADRDDDSEVLQAYYANTPIADDKPLGQLRASKGYIRRPIPIRRRMEGMAMRLDQLLPTKDTRLFDISVRVYAEEATRT
jgi:hypothetical protein